MITFPLAKINFGLRITGRRSNGFHDIETIFYPVCLCDALEFVSLPHGARSDEISLTGIDIKTRNESNLVIRAIRLLRENFTIPWLRIHLHKAIPAGAGLGGGSSDAAFILRSLNKWYNLGASKETLRSLALELGSDCPFFVDPVPSLATGMGEILDPVKAVLKGLYVILVNPGISISTRDAYLNCKPLMPENNLIDLVTADRSSWRRTIKNDFEDYVFTIYPQVREIKKTLYASGAVYASMSGSGSTVYGIYEGRPNLDTGLKKYIIYEGIL